VKYWGHETQNLKNQENSNSNFWNALQSVLISVLFALWSFCYPLEEDLGAVKKAQEVPVQKSTHWKKRGFISCGYFRVVPLISIAYCLAKMFFFERFRDPWLHFLRCAHSHPQPQRWWCSGFLFSKTAPREVLEIYFNHDWILDWSVYTRHIQTFWWLRRLTVIGL